MYRCYACKTSFSETVKESTASIGLCEQCQRRSSKVKHQLALAEPSRFGEDYFQQDDVDEPTCVPQRRCQRCGIVGETFNWNSWSFDHNVMGTGGSPQATGDGYSYCQNCTTLTVTPWSESSAQVQAAPVAISQPELINTGSTDWVMESILLLLLAIAVVISFL